MPGIASGIGHPHVGNIISRDASDDPHHFNNDNTTEGRPDHSATRGNGRSQEDRDGHRGGNDNDNDGHNPTNGRTQDTDTGRAPRADDATAPNPTGGDDGGEVGGGPRGPGTGAGTGGGTQPNIGGGPGSILNPGGFNYGGGQGGILGGLGGALGGIVGGLGETVSNLGSLVFGPGPQGSGNGFHDLPAGSGGADGGRGASPSGGSNPGSNQQPAPSIGGSEPRTDVFPSLIGRSQSAGQPTQPGAPQPGAHEPGTTQPGATQPGAPSSQPSNVAAGNVDRAGQAPANPASVSNPNQAVPAGADARAATTAEQAAQQRLQQQTGLQMLAAGLMGTMAEEAMPPQMLPGGPVATRTPQDEALQPGLTLTQQQAQQRADLKDAAQLARRDAPADARTAQQTQQTPPNPQQLAMAQDPKRPTDVLERFLNKLVPDQPQQTRAQADVKQADARLVEGLAKAEADNRQRETERTRIANSDARMQAADAGAKRGAFAALAGGMAGSASETVRQAMDWVGQQVREFGFGADAGSEGVRAMRVVAGLIAASVIVGVAIALLYALRIVFVA